MESGLTADEAVAILEHLGAELVERNGFVFAKIRLDATGCVRPHVDLRNPELEGRATDRFRRELGLTFDEFARLRCGSMSLDEYRSLIAGRLAHD